MLYHSKRLVLCFENITIMVQFISLISILITHFLFFSCLNLFLAPKLRNKGVYAPFDITGVSNERKEHLRVKPIIERNIGFLLEFDQYSSG